MFETLFVSAIVSIVIVLLINFIDIKFGIKSAVIVGLVLILLCILGVSVWMN